MLTDDQRDVLRLLAEGMTEPQIAEALIVCRRTIYLWKKKLAAKLGITPRQLKWRAQARRAELMELLG